MKQTIKSTFVLPFLFAGTSFTSFAETLWVDGVSQTSGWYDTNKTVDANKENYTSMAFHCHTAAAANLIAWWQDKYSNIPAGVATGYGVWESFCEYAVEDSGGSCHKDVQWWVSGTGVNYFSTQTSPYASFNITEASLASFATYTGTFASVTVSDFLKTAVQSGYGIALCLDIYHDVTLWGIETDAAGSVEGLWLADSDDGKAKYGGVTGPDIFYVEVETYSKSFNGQTNTTLKIKDSSLADTDPDSDRGLGTAYITGVYTIDPKVSDTWGLVRKSDDSAPEPATFTLSMLGIAALAARRRRK